MRGINEDRCPSNFFSIHGNKSNLPSQICRALNGLHVYLPLHCQWGNFLLLLLLTTVLRKAHGQRLHRSIEWVRQCRSPFAFHLVLWQFFFAICDAQQYLRPCFRIHIPAVFSNSPRYGYIRGPLDLTVCEIRIFGLDVRTVL